MANLTNISRQCPYKEFAKRQYLKYQRKSAVQIE